MIFNPECLSSFLAFRYLVDPDMSWKPGLTPEFPLLSDDDQTAVGNASQVKTFLESACSDAGDLGKTGLLLSGGIDSAILSAYLPKGTHCFTIKFVADGAEDEADAAARYAEAGGHHLHVVAVTWEDYLANCDKLMAQKKAPLHAVEVGLFMASRAAAEMGISKLITGNGADSTFGGMDKLLSQDWSFDDFVKRYTFIQPAAALCEPTDITSTYEKYRVEADGIDVISFLKTTHGLGIVQAFENALHAGGCSMIQPYEQLKLDGELDLARIRGGESKYILRKVFSDLFQGMDVPEKIPFARPMDQWLADWAGPSRYEFLPGLDLTQFTGDQKWLLFCLDRFLTLMDEA